MSHLRSLPDGGNEETAAQWLRRVGPKLRAARDQGAVEDARDLKRRLRTAALKTDQVYDEVKDLCGDVHVDGHVRAAAKLGSALLKLKQAELELEEARELVMAERQRA